VSVRGSSGRLEAIAVLRLAISASVEPTTWAAATTAGNSARIAETSVIGSVTPHWVSCALDGLMYSFPSLPVVA